MSDESNALVIELDRDKMFADLFCVSADTDDAFTTLEEAKQKLQENKIIFGIDEEKIKEALNQLPEMEINTVTRIAEGLKPKKGTDGYIDFKLNVTGEATYEETEDEKNVDFKKATGVVNVHPGDTIAVLVPPVAGTPGRSVLGENLAHPRPREAFLRAGQGVDCSDGLTFIAAADGRPVYLNGLLSVLPLYEVAGDVDYSTGHIEFAGSVVVNGNVKDDFNIKAKDVLVMGTVGVSHIVSNGDITIHGGVAGKDKAKLVAGGTVKAKYINNTNIECLGDIEVSREIVHCTVLCNSKIRAQSIIGGNIMAKMGIDVDVLGSDLGVSTRIEPGGDLELRKIENTINLINEKLDNIIKPVKLFFGERAKYKALPQDKKDEFIARFEGFKRLYSAFVKLSKSKQELIMRSGIKPVKEVIVRKIMHPDTIISTELCMKNFAKQSTGPLKVIEDVDHSTMAIKNV
jgi:hypothetical protein